LNRTARTTLKIAVLAPMPSAIVTVAVRAKVGALTNARNAYETSHRRSSSHRIDRASR